ncbi:quinolinate synthase NadA [Candidatus Woesearchaeota archaeon]|nr:quinolinate synthase NadA [Candidatus Woesearchaeota archaeon]
MVKTMLNTMQLEMKLLEIDSAIKQTGKDQQLEFLAQKDIVRKILELQQSKNALILGHNYMAPLVFHISPKEARGDSLQLAQYAAKATNPLILFNGVRFMAETAKILNPDKKVLIADETAGCSLADPCRAENVRAYKKQYPGLPVILYINSYADAKTEADYCCTSSNGLNVVKHAAKEFGVDRVLFLPDSLMGANLQEEVYSAGLDIDIIYPSKYDNNYGACEVHEQITLEMVRAIRQQYKLPKQRVGEKNPKTAALVHLECRPEVREEADYCGSTSGMIKYLSEHLSLERVYLGTECEMTANLQAEFPNIQFIRTCAIACQHMAKIRLQKIANALETEQPEINVQEDIRRKAIIPIQRMLAIPKD